MERSPQGGDAGRDVAAQIHPPRVVGRLDTIEIDHGGAGPTEVQVTATAVEPPAPEIRLVPGELDFEDRRVGEVLAPPKIAFALATLRRLQPDALGRLAAGLEDGVGLISATNGKTTTARLAVAALRADGRSPIANTAGANLSSGVATALLDAASTRPTPRTALLEVDEAALPEVVRQLAPRVLEQQAHDVVPLGQVAGTEHHTRVEAHHRDAFA